MKVMTVFGTRPEAIKMAPLVRALKSDPYFECSVCVTAQHREMLDQVLDVFGIVPDFDLDIMKKGQTVSGITSAVLEGVGGVLDSERPDAVLVHGDTTTSFAAALAAFYRKIPVGHVEAGLRTYDRYSPFPEEMNRQLTGRLASFHFAPTEANAENLAAEGVCRNGSRVFVTGNTVIDALLWASEVSDEGARSALSDICPEGGRIITVTCHRRENQESGMDGIFSALADIAKENRDVTVVFPVHLNPEVRRKAEAHLDGIDNVRLTGPLSYLDFVSLMKRSYMIVTDSGGMQEEAPALGKPVVVVRNETERPEAVAAGTAILAGTDRENIRRICGKLLSDDAFYDSMSRAVNPYGDGNACARILEALKTL